MDFYKVHKESLPLDLKTVWRILAIVALITVMFFVLFWSSIWLKGHWFWSYQKLFLPAVFISLAVLFKFRPAWFITPRRTVITGVCAGLLISTFAHYGSYVFDQYGIERLYSVYNHLLETIKYTPIILLLLAGWLFGGAFSLTLFMISRRDAGAVGPSTTP